MRIEAADLAAIFDDAALLEELERSLVAPVGPARILEFFEVPTGDAFDVPPEQGINYFAAKGLRPSFSYAEMLDQEHDRAFTVAKMMNVDMLAQMRASLESALANGTPYKEWADSIVPSLQAAGWWGRKEVLDPLTGQTIVAQLGAPHRLQTIFRTNMQSAYAAGAWQEIEAQKDLAPFLMYDAVDDMRTRPLHMSWDRLVLPVGHPWWHTHNPPNGYNCRCGVIQLSAEEVKDLGLTVAKQAPDNGTYAWKNPRTGEVLQVPQGLDPGFAHNPGVSWKQKLDQVQAEKASQLKVDMRAAAAKAKAESDAAMKALAKAQGEAALKRSMAKIEERTKQWSAQQQLDAIGKGKETAGKGAAYKIKALATLKKSAEWAALKPTEQLQQLLAMADDLKYKNELAAKLSTYKKAILEGKVPSPSLVSAFNTMDDDAKAAFLAKIEAEKAALAPPPPPPAAPKVVTGQPPNPAKLVQIGEQRGSNPGGLFQDTETGTKWYLKQPASEDIVRNEVLAGKLYELAGVDVPEMHVITMNGKPSIVSRIVDGLAKGTPAQLATAAGTADGFIADAWLANWDVIGLGFDNLLLRGATAFRVDTGGALRYRAQGSLKGAAWGDEVTELQSLRDPSKNRQSHEVFGRLTDEQLENAAVRVLKITDDDIRAIVEQHGPIDAKERKALADRLVARKRFLAAKFPRADARARAETGAADTPPPPPARVTADEQREIEASRVNGVGMATDSDQIEDHMVMVHTYRTTQGTDATRGYMKLLAGASKSLEDRVRAAAGDLPVVALATARDSIFAAVKSINFRADQGKVLDDTVVKKILIAHTDGTAAIDQIEKALKEAADPAPLLAMKDTIEEWMNDLSVVLIDAQEGAIATKLDRIFPVKDLPDELAYKTKTSKAKPAVTWRRVKGPYKYNAAEFDRSNATETAKQTTVHGADLRYETELPDGTKVVYFPHDPQVAWTMQGVVKIDAAGKGVASSERIFAAMEEIGIKSDRATSVDREHLYLNAFARIQLLRGPAARFQAEFSAIANTGEDAVRQKLAVLKKATGVDIEASEGWKTRDGVRQAFGHGRAHIHRPDLSAAELEKLNKTHVVFHNPVDLGASAGPGMFERLKMIIEGGGTMASLSDRVRRGVPLNGSSVSADLQTGGGDYFFTRIRQRSYAKGTGLYWRTTTLRRMDAITYNSDQFGNTTAGHVEQNRLGQTIDSLKDAAKNSSNETIFKGGMSIFDDLDSILLWDDDEVDAAIAWMRSKGYDKWPDGRALKDVIVTFKPRKK